MKFTKFLLLNFLAFTLVVGAYAQGNNENEQHTPANFQKTVNDNRSTIDKSNGNSLSTANKKEKANPHARETVSSTEKNPKLATAVPATKMDQTAPLKSISYSLNNDNSTLTNLLNLIELKERANQEINASLLSTKSYATLIQDINTLRTDFDQYVNQKGFQNCSTSEQSYYLSFLKEEGKMDQYQSAIKQIK